MISRANSALVTCRTCLPRCTRRQALALAVARANSIVLAPAAYQFMLRYEVDLAGGEKLTQGSNSSTTRLQAESGSGDSSFRWGAITRGALADRLPRERMAQMMAAGASEQSARGNAAGLQPGSLDSMKDTSRPRRCSTGGRALRQNQMVEGAALRDLFRHARAQARPRYLRVMHWIPRGMTACTRWEALEPRISLAFLAAAQERAGRSSIA